MAKIKAEYYVDPDKFKQEIGTYYETEVCTDYLGECLNKIAAGLGYSPCFISYCVDDQTEALTQRGWLTYDKIALQDIILSYNIESKQLVWSKITDLYINNEYNGKMFKLTNKGIDALVTPGHRFVTQNGLKPIDLLIGNDKIVLTGLPVDSPNHKIFSDDFVKHSPDRVMSYEFLNALTQSQRLLLIKTMVDGGWTRRGQEYNIENTPLEFVQKDIEAKDRFIYICTLAGLTTTTRLVDNISKFGKNPYYSTNTYHKPKYTAKVGTSNMYGSRPGPGGSMTTKGAVGKISKPNQPTIEYQGTVWCPKTEHGNWMCRRNGRVYITGNTYKDEMQGDAIVKMFSALKRKKYKMESESNPFSYFTTISFHAFINRIKKEKKHHQTLTEYKEKVYFDTMQEDSNGQVYIKPHVTDIEDAGFDSD